ncbi:hypothetical protein EC574_01915 [Helicobacter pylori]|uniref:Uncharacterized protein n=1 Tax=Helicobacter pylori TaxID=210 RepID=A0A438ZM92_HELPX|nr:hypothetical protein EC574_01915 [Helicobacter pylori]
MAFFNIFKLNFLKFYYRIFNKGTDFTPTKLERIFLKHARVNTLGRSNPIKSQGHRARIKLS